MIKSKMLFKNNKLSFEWLMLENQWATAGHFYIGIKVAIPKMDLVYCRTNTIL